MTPEGRANHLAAMNRPEVRAKISAGYRKWWAEMTPEERKSQVARIRAAMNRPEVRAKLSASNQGKHSSPLGPQTPEHIAHIRDRRLGLHAERLSHLEFTRRMVKLAQAVDLEFVEAEIERERRYLAEAKAAQAQEVSS